MQLYNVFILNNGTFSVSEKRRVFVVMYRSSKRLMIAIINMF